MPSDIDNEKCRSLIFALMAFVIAPSIAFASSSEDSVVSILHGLQPGDRKVFTGNGPQLIFDKAGPGTAVMIVEGNNQKAMTRFTYKPLGQCTFQLVFSVANGDGDQFTDQFVAKLDFSNVESLVTNPTNLLGLNQASLKGLGFECAAEPNGACPPKEQLKFFTTGDQTTLRRALDEFTAHSCDVP